MGQRLKLFGKTSAAVLKNVMGPFVGSDEMCDAIGYVENDGAPSSVTPQFIGQKLFDTSGLNFYIAFGTAAGEWSPISVDTLTLAELAVLDGFTGTTAALNIATVPASRAEVVAATNVITAEESGKTFFLNHTTEFVSTLPAPALGLKFSFVVTGAPSGASYTILTDASAQVIIGRVLCSADAAGDTENTAGGTTITFVDGQAVMGDRVDIESDGTNWYCVCVCAVAAGITITG